MEKLELKAYLIPGMGNNGKQETKIFRSKWGASIAASQSSEGLGYLIEGKIGKVYRGNIKERIFGKQNYQNKDEFINDLEKNFKYNSQLSERQIEEFSKKKGLTPTRLFLMPDTIID